MISIIIVNYNTPDLTISCIKSIIEHVRIDFEIIVVDNHSCDDSIEKLKSNCGQEIILIESPENLGFGRANNLGATYAKGKYLFLLNSDTVLNNDPFKWFIPFYESSSEIGAIGAYLKDGRGEYTLSGGKTFSIRKYLKIALRGLLRKRNNKFEAPLKDEIQEVDYVIGADLFISKNLFRKSGGFDQNIFMYFEDVELCRKLVDKGFKNYLIPGPQIVHFVKSSSTSQFARVYNTASLMYCIRKSTSFLKFKIFQISYFLLKMPILLRLHSFKKEWEYITTIFQYKKYLTHQ